MKQTMKQDTLNKIFHAIELLEEVGTYEAPTGLLMDCPLRGEGKDRELIEASIVGALCDAGVVFDAEVDVDMYLDSVPCPSFIMEEDEEDTTTQDEDDEDENRIYILQCPNKHTFHYPFKTFIETGEINCPHCAKDGKLHIDESVD